MFEQHNIPLDDEIDQVVAAKKRAAPERGVQRAGTKWLRQMIPGSIVASIVNEQRGSGQIEQQRMRYGQARKASGVVTGFFDTIALLKEGRCLLVEWKAPGGVISTAQLDIHHQARTLGHLVVVADSIESLRLGVSQVGIGTIESPGQQMRPPNVSVAKRKHALPADLVPF